MVDSGSYAEGPESGQGVGRHSEMVPSGEGQQQREALPTGSFQPYQAQQVSDNTAENESAGHQLLKPCYGFVLTQRTLCK